MESLVVGICNGWKDCLCHFFLLEGGSKNTLSLHYCLAWLSFCKTFGLNQRWIGLVFLMACSSAKCWLFNIAAFLVRIQFPSATLDVLSSSSSGLFGNKNWSFMRHLCYHDSRSKMISFCHCKSFCSRSDSVLPCISLLGWSHNWIIKFKPVSSIVVVQRWAVICKGVVWACNSSHLVDQCPTNRCSHPICCWDIRTGWKESG